MGAPYIAGKNELARTHIPRNAPVSWIRARRFAEAFASSSESAEHARSDFPPVMRRFAPITSSFHETIELREPCRLRVAVRRLVDARDELRGKRQPLVLGEGTGRSEKFLGRAGHRP